MKNINIIVSIKTALFLCLIAIMVNSCTPDNGPELDGTPRLFRPVLIGNKLVAQANNIIVNFAPTKGVVKYRAEISRDSFATAPLRIIESSNSVITFDNLIYNKPYQVRGQAFASDPALDSKVADFGEIKTERFPSILTIPASEDIIDNGLNVRWTVQGSPVTTIKIFTGDDEELANPLATYSTTEAQQLAGLRSVKLLQPNTSYTVAIYSGDVLRGYEVFTTKPPLPTEGNILDLRGDDTFDPLTDDGTYLSDKLTEASAQPITTVILDGDQTYILNGFQLTNSIKVISGYSLTSGGAGIYVNNNFNTAPGTSNIGSVVFEGIKFQGQGIGKNYLFAPTNDYVTIGEWKFTNCTISDFRGMFRLRGGNGGEITNFAMDKCDVSQIGGYYVLNTDNGAWDFKDATFTNSTFHQIERFVKNKHSGSNFTVTIDNCTFFEVAKAGNPFLDVSSGATLTNLSISNTVFGHGWDTSGADPANYAFKFITSPNDVTVASFSNVYDTADSAYTSGNAPSDLGSTFKQYPGSSTDLFEDPANNIFYYKDSNFDGKSSAGDPRWIL